MANISINEFAILVTNKINLDNEELIAEVKETTKNNGVIFTGITFSNDSNNYDVYLNDLYARYSMGWISICDAAEMVMKIYKKNQMAFVDTDDFLDFDKVKNRIVYKLINKAKNEELLEDVPHIELLDLAIIFCVFYPSVENRGMALATIHNNHMQMWNTDVDKIYEMAKENTSKLLPVKLTSMDDMILELKENMEMAEEEYEMIPDNGPAYVLTNVANAVGAACILYEDVLKNFAEKIDDDVVILPSSINDTILIPASLTDDISYLTEMVREINATQVRPDEVLSDNVYVYSRKTNEIQKADDEELAA